MDTIKRVQDLMQERDMNLCVLAKKCGISYSTIQTTARRGGQLSVETIERICQPKQGIPDYSCKEGESL